MTYEGSITYPGCHETATWMVMNKPMYITNDQVSKYLVRIKIIFKMSTHLANTAYFQLKESLIGFLKIVISFMNLVFVALQYPFGRGLYFM